MGQGKPAGLRSIRMLSELSRWLRFRKNMERNRLSNFLLNAIT